MRTSGSKEPAAGGGKDTCHEFNDDQGWMLIHNDKQRRIKLIHCNNKLEWC